MAIKKSHENAPVGTKPLVGKQAGIFNNDRIGVFLDIDTVGGTPLGSVKIDVEFSITGKSWFKDGHYTLERRAWAGDAKQKAANEFGAGKHYLIVEPPPGAKLARVIAWTTKKATESIHYVISTELGWNYEE